jgi:large subunit ribosomal protein L6
MEATTSEAPLRQSRLGKRPVEVPKGVTLKLNGNHVDVQGPKGKLERDFPEGVVFKQEGDKIFCTSSMTGRDAPRLQGLGRALLASMVKGCAEGYERGLELVGTGYRCEAKGKTINFSLGLSHPATIDLPASVSAVIPPESKGTILLLSSADKALLGEIAATIRHLRPPEPYGGKGIRYRGEQIRRKAGKAGKAKAK